MRIKLLVTCPTLFVNGAQRVGNVSCARFVGLERRRSRDRVVPMFRPDSIRFAQSGWPGEHRLVEFHPDCAAKRAQNSFGILENILRIDHWGDRAGLAVWSAVRANELKYLALLDKSEIFERRVGVLLSIRENHLPRITDEKTVRKIGHPCSVDFR